MSTDDYDANYDDWTPVPEETDTTAYLNNEAIEQHARYERAVTTMWDAIGRDKANGTDDVFTLAKAEIERLRADYAKLHGVVETYISAPGQIRGDAYRDLTGTMDHLAGRDDGLGWAACWQKQQVEIERLRAIVDRLPKTADGVPVTPGMTLWGAGGGYGIQINRVGPYRTYPLMYSTREEAEAAQETALTTNPN
jgi:hypothetical protein